MPKKPENLDLYDEHEEVVSKGGKKVRRRGIFLLPNLLTTASLFAGFFSIISSNDTFEYYLEVVSVEDSIVIAKIIGSVHPVYTVREGDMILISK